MKNHWPVILGVGVPAVFLLVIMGIAFFPMLGGGPSHKILLTNDKGYGDYTEKIENGRLVLIPDEQRLKTVYIDESGIEHWSRREPDMNTRVSNLYVYDVTDDSMKEISLEEAQKLTLDAGPVSDDGFSVGFMGYPEYSDRGIFNEVFGSRSRNQRNLQLSIYRNGREVDRIIVPENPDSLGYGYYGYYGELRFLAWIK